MTMNKMLSDGQIYLKLFKKMNMKLFIVLSFILAFQSLPFAASANNSLCVKPSTISKTDLLSNYRQFHQTLKNMASHLRQNMTEDHIKSFTHPDGKLNFSLAINPLHLPTDSRLREQIRRAYNQLHDRNKVIQTIERLMLDVAQDIHERGIPREIEALKLGHLTRNAVLRVLVKRAKHRGERISSLREVDSASFGDTVAKGPFFDLAVDTPELRAQRDNLFKATLLPHGVDSHLIQRELIIDLFESPQDVDYFFSHLGLTENGQHIWSSILDALPIEINDLSSPAGVINLLGPFLKNK